ncbi:hypothetical protein E1A91_D03G004600v1 [Gossypium mustelinum]|uniref:F-box domain-containing protein n=1 Tax=Gossypium mustelinum TaxID=34275 RepID=A0A5D2VHA1_GOSMU|nr:hypothetical protein E1A91_D03G004600v1 [Gossypium mustelinum]
MGRRDWSGLPDELLTKIGQYVSGHFDMIRFRSVCRRWRHSLPLSHTNNWHLHLQITLLKEPKPDYRIRIPLPFYESYDPELEAESSPYHTVPSSIVKTTVCIINQSSLLKLEETQQEEYDDKVCMVLVLCDHGRLLLWRNGDEHMKEISNKFRYDDIAVYKGHFIAIDRWGTVSFVDSSSLTVIQYTPPVLSGGKKKNLVVCSEQLYVADRYFDRARKSQNPYGKWDPSVVDFKIYKLDEDWGRWIEITSLNDQILFLGKVLNFFVPIKELSGCNKGNCIYFRGDEFIGSKSHGVSVFDLADRRIGSILSFPGCSDMLCPPSWFTAN